VPAPILTQEGADYLWTLALGGDAAGPLTCHLIGPTPPPTDDHTQTLETLRGSELGVPGYTPFALPFPTWTLSDVLQGAQALTQDAQWSLGGACVVAGGWLSWDAVGLSYFYFTFSAAPGPYTFPAAGGVFYLLLQPSLISVP
jgi:hypothetical protein